MFEASTLYPLGLLMAFFLLVVLAYGWMGRRQSYLHDQLVERRGEHERLRGEAAALAEEVSECRHGISANALAVRNLEGEIAALQGKIELFLQEHPELMAEYAGLKAQPEAAPPEEQE